MDKTLSTSTSFPDSAQLPHSTLSINRITLEQGVVLHRIHPVKYESVQFNASAGGNARFSPLKTNTDVTIPTIYAGSTFDCAALETAFHDVPFTVGFKSIAKAKLNSLVYSKVEVTEAVYLADLSTVGLRKIGISKAKLIETNAVWYPVTRLWAEAIYNQDPEVKGLKWTSRQDDRADAYVFFGDRLPPNWLKPVGLSKSLTNDASTYLQLIQLAEIIGVEIVNS